MNPAELMALARQAADGAYAPYSRYPVGAAVLTADGRVFTGCNVENASYGLTNCAERTAVFKAVSEGARAIQAVAIAGGKGGKPALPCGACRQVLAEFGGPETPVHVAPLDAPDEIQSFTLAELLPHSFKMGKS